MPEYWKNRYRAHAIIGGLSGVITLASTIIVVKWLDWSFYFDHWHNVAGILFMVLCQMLVLGGVFALILRKLVNFDWKTKSLLKMTSIHKYFGYFMIFATQVAVTTGILRRVNISFFQDQPKKVALVILNILFFFGTLLLLEIRHQRRLRVPVALKFEGLADMTL